MAPAAPPRGARLTLAFDAEQDARIELQGEVTRVAKSDGRIGFAIEWVQARTYGTERLLRRFLTEMMGVAPLVHRRRTGHAAWTPKPRRRVSPLSLVPSPDESAPAAAAPTRSAAVPSMHRPEPPSARHPDERYAVPSIFGSPDFRPSWATGRASGQVESPGGLSPGAPGAPGAPIELSPPAGNVVRLVPKVGQERRAVARRAANQRVSFRFDATTLRGTVVELSEQALWVHVTDRRLPRVGELLACRYPIPELGGHQVRLVGRVVRQGVDLRCDGFALEILRVDERGLPGAFPGHVGRLESVEAVTRPIAPQG